jgi:antitoxin component YwqK of YwqJK toxin-antitoxin module
MLRTKIFRIGMLFLLLMHACGEDNETLTLNRITNTVDTLITGCLVSYDINPSDNKERINQVFGKDHIKDGHWITFALAVTKNSKVKTSKVKIEEGYYRKNKKVGVWKFYNEDGTIRDSVEYKNYIPIANKSY